MTTITGHRTVVFVLISVLIPLIVLQLTGCMRSTEALIAELKDPDPDVSADAAEELGKRKERRAVQPLIEMLRSEGRTPAAKALGKIGDPAAVDALLDALKDDFSVLRKESAEALGLIGDPRAVNGLIPLLRDEEEDVRYQAAWALGELKDPTAVPHLIEALEDSNEQVRYDAAEALGKIQDPRSVEPLIQKLNDIDADVQRKAEMVLMKMTGNDFGQDAERWSRWWAENKSQYEDPLVFKAFAEMNEKKYNDAVLEEIKRRRKK